MRIIAEDYTYDIPYEDATITVKEIAHHLPDENGYLSEYTVPAYKINAHVGKADITLAICPTKEDYVNTMKQLLRGEINRSKSVFVENDYSDRFLEMYQAKVAVKKAEQVCEADPLFYRED